VIFGRAPDARSCDAHGSVAEAVDGEVAEMDLAGGGGVGSGVGYWHYLLLYGFDSRDGALGAGEGYRYEGKLWRSAVTRQKF
jgi:hypothetical protein